jgi:hypothetical protein
MGYEYREVRDMAKDKRGGGIGLNVGFSVRRWRAERREDWPRGANFRIVR